ncbi:MAG: hypothetical protein OK436_05870 [Thaumarchaeota archaeon]|nr:hypothetical protein [Nitrososphaerota archaeon]
MIGVTRAIQGLILFSTVLGVFFLWQVYPLLPAFAFDFVAFGWVLFLVDGILTFVRPRASYYLGLVLGLFALGETLSQRAHYSLITSGNLTATATLVLGSAAQALLVTLVVYYVAARRRKDPWAWPGANSQA